MSQYAKAKNMHQYYRDVLSKDLRLPNIGVLSREWVVIDVSIKHVMRDFCHLFESSIILK